ncbi:MAG: riboflavin kinase/FAD synthetase [Ilumatobacteraceae bacterium]|nr:riboflavin kinase/FAD synthetase [Ilumatobacteraceae bacterium]
MVVRPAACGTRQTLCWRTGCGDAVNQISGFEQSATPSDGTWARSDLAFTVQGRVEAGDQRGRLLGFPTANLSIEPQAHYEGVWAGWLTWAGVRHAAAISVGGRPTFYGRDGFRLLEAHVLDFDEDIYGETVTVWMCQRLRTQRKFESLDALVAQLRSDVASTRRWASEGGEAREGVRGFTLPNAETAAGATGTTQPALQLEAIPLGNLTHAARVGASSKDRIQVDNTYIPSADEIRIPKRVQGDTAADG